MKNTLSAKLKQDLEDELTQILEEHWEGIEQENTASGIKLICAFLLGFFLSTIIGTWAA